MRTLPEMKTAMSGRTDTAADTAHSSQYTKTDVRTSRSGMVLSDPSEKDNIIGVFHRVYTAEEVLLELLEGEFEQVTERRYTWQHGDGTPEGVWVHDAGLHVGSCHNSWPIDGIVNLWDLVRVFKFGHLDTDSLPVGDRMSDKAMSQYARSLAKIQNAASLEGS